MTVPNTGSATCTFIAVNGVTGILTLAVSPNEKGAVVVSCTSGSAADAGVGPYMNVTAYPRVGVCVLQLTAQGEGVASASAS